MLVKYLATPAVLTDKQVADFYTDGTGNLRSLLCGTASTPGDAVPNASVLWVMQSNTLAAANRPLGVASYTFNGATWDRYVKPNSTFRLLSSAATTNSNNVKASAGNVHKITGNNTVAVKKYLKLYNKATAPTVGTDTPVLTFAIPVSAAFAFDLSDVGHYFSAGIGIAITAAAADADATAIGSGDIECLNLTYS